MHMYTYIFKIDKSSIFIFQYKFLMVCCREKVEGERERSRFMTLKPFELDPHWEVHFTSPPGIPPGIHMCTHNKNVSF